MIAVKIRVAITAFQLEARMGCGGRVRAGRVSGGLTWTHRFNWVGVANLLALESRWLNCVGLTCFYFGDGYPHGVD